jgi:hypothetical protein
LAIWRLVLELQQQPRDGHGELCEEDRVALRDATAELARVVGFSKFELEPGTCPDEPWPWAVATNNSVQLRRWQESKQIRDALNAALLAATAAQVPTPTARRRAKTTHNIQSG